MRLQGKMSTGQFAQNLSILSEGELPVNPSNDLTVFEDLFIRIVRKRQELKSSVLTDTCRHFMAKNWLFGRANPAARNSDKHKKIKELVRGNGEAC
jgi:hypothetical protein